MNSQRHIHNLRVHLLAMSRLSQRALDYSVKGYELPSLDFARQVGTESHRLDEHYCRIKELCREAVNGGIANAGDFRLAFAALSIAAALHATYSVAEEIAQSTILRLENGGIEKCAQLRKLGRTVNASMRLCLISLFEEDAHHAEIALSHGKQVVELGAGSDADDSVSPQQGFNYAVTRGLVEIAKQTQEIADALLFWLEGNRTATVISITEGRYLSRKWPQAPQQDATQYIPSQGDIAPNASRRLPC